MRHSTTAPVYKVGVMSRRYLQAAAGHKQQRRQHRDQRRKHQQPPASSGTEKLSAACRTPAPVDAAHHHCAGACRPTSFLARDAGLGLRRMLCHSLGCHSCKHSNALLHTEIMTPWTLPHGTMSECRLLRLPPRLPHPGCCWRSGLLLPVLLLLAVLAAADRQDSGYCKNKDIHTTL